MNSGNTKCECFTMSKYTYIINIQHHFSTESFISDWKIYQYPEIMEISQKLKSTKIYDACVKLLKQQTDENKYISILKDFSVSNDSLLTNQVIMFIEDNFDKASR